MSSLALAYAAFCHKKTTEPIPEAKTIFEKHGVHLHVDNLDPEELRVLFDFIAKTTTLQHARIFLGRVPMKRALRTKLLRMGLDEPYAMQPLGHMRIVRSLSSMLLHATSLVSLDLVGVPIASETVQDLAKGLKAATTLVSIDLSESKLGDAGLDQLEDALATQPQLLHLSLASCELSDKSARALSRILRVQCQRRDETYWSTTLRGQTTPIQGEGCMLLSVASNALGDATTEVLCQALYNDNWLYGLNLAANAIGPRGVLNLAEALQTNSTLTVLVLRGNSAADARVTTFVDRMLQDRVERATSSMHHPMEHPLLKRVLQQWRGPASVVPPVARKKVHRRPPSPPMPSPSPLRPPPAPTPVRRPLVARKVTSIYANTNGKSKQKKKKTTTTKASAGILRKEPLHPSPSLPPPPPGIGAAEASALDLLVGATSPGFLRSNQDDTAPPPTALDPRTFAKLMAKIEALEAAQASAQAHIDRLEADNQRLKQQQQKARRPSVEASIISELEAAIIRLTQQVQYLEAVRDEQPRAMPHDVASKLPDAIVDDLAAQLKLSFGLTP
ncbi:hypothetical protein SPRG_19903 [Saprolegnia parasitica CBS 223.65]|uniref:RNI-like protein n=1 Tax=Saprolegnia parasitica (strain CBS 223.65) TaxID=695850 RepID=A0A067CR24_SAPPC|nr:hypothetical protein SPRG_19903 [Saprolegnia parasitica CBS 223.65]KDO29237.1 hypothetical protein SPRG_19903 [Saprolegnia parasitica CBS 223.65]|eukprot:XP_012200130.1 hypothetical protein SPRG_19903 [Saprolegnia parasitica CBS 223.65]